MSRQIKFRAWEKKTKTMNEVLVIDWLNNLVDLEFGKIERYFSEVVLMQYTGLKDENDKEIYEGDIVTFETNDYDRTGGNINDITVVGDVTYDVGCFFVDGIPLYDSYFDELEIIVVGNIFDNEKLEEEAEWEKE